VTQVQSQRSNMPRPLAMNQQPRVVFTQTLSRITDLMVNLQAIMVYLVGQYGLQ
jgi:hypothetical protein